MICAHCGAKAQGNYSCFRDGPECGPEVPLCDRCGGTSPGDLDFVPLETIWQRISTYVPFPNEASRRVAERYAAYWPEDAPFALNGESAARWLVALACCWAGSSMFTKAHRNVTFDDLADRCRSSEELQKMVSAAYQAKAHPFSILMMVQDWSSHVGTSGDQGIEGCGKADQGEGRG